MLVVENVGQVLSLHRVYTQFCQSLFKLFVRYGLKAVFHQVVKGVWYVDIHHFFVNTYLVFSLFFLFFSCRVAWRYIKKRFVATKQRVHSCRIKRQHQIGRYAQMVLCIEGQCHLLFIHACVFGGMFLAACYE